MSSFNCFPWCHFEHKIFALSMIVNYSLCELAFEAEIMLLLYFRLDSNSEIFWRGEWVGFSLSLFHLSFAQKEILDTMGEFKRHFLHFGIQTQAVPIVLRHRGKFLTSWINECKLYFAQMISHLISYGHLI